MLTILPPSFRNVLGDGPVYREPDQVADTVRYLQAEEQFYDPALIGAQLSWLDLQIVPRVRDLGGFEV